MPIEVTGPLFPLGVTVATRAALERLDHYGISALELILRHALGDWGDLVPEDREANEEALVHGHRLLSSYRLSETDSVWVITEWDRSVTTVLCPEDY